MPSDLSIFSWEPPMAGTEAEHLLGALDRLRTDVPLEGRRPRRRPGSAPDRRATLTLGGLLKHLAAVEDHYFTVKLPGEPIGEPWDDTGGTAATTGSSPRPPTTPPSDLYALYDGAVGRARARLGAALPTAASTS